MLLDDFDFIKFLQIKELIDEYNKTKKAEFEKIDKKFKEDKEKHQNLKIDAIRIDRNHRRILNACIFPFAQVDPPLGYHFIRASPLSEKRVKNLDFLLLHHKEPITMILGEAKSSSNDPDAHINQYKERIEVIETEKEYIYDKYLDKLKPAIIEYVLGIGWADSNEISKSILRKKGQICVWSIGPQLEIDKHEPIIKLFRPSSSKDNTAKSMLHNDRNLTNLLSESIKTSFEYKSIFHDSHIFSKLLLLLQIDTNEDIFTKEDILTLVSEELDYLDPHIHENEADKILKTALDIGFLEKTKIDSTIKYKIRSKYRTTSGRESDLKMKWIDHEINLAIDEEKNLKLKEIQGQFKNKRTKYKTLDEYRSDF